MLFRKPELRASAGSSLAVLSRAPFYTLAPLDGHDAIVNVVDKTTMAANFTCAAHGGLEPFPVLDVVGLATAALAHCPPIGWTRNDGRAVTEVSRWR